MMMLPQQMIENRPLLVEIRREQEPSLLQQDVGKPREGIEGHAIEVRHTWLLS
jgi:hypothetical protein